MARRAAVFLTWLLITAVGDGFLGMPSQAEAPPVEAGVAEAPESDMEDAAGLDGTAAEATVFADSPEMPPEDVAGTATTDGSPEPVTARPTPSRIRLKLDVQGEIFAPAGHVSSMYAACASAAVRILDTGRSSCRKCRWPRCRSFS